MDNQIALFEQMKKRENPNKMDSSITLKIFYSNNISMRLNPIRLWKVKY